MTKTLPITPNTLIQYEGGGYDGCFWEWNYSYVDEAGKYHVLHASGYKGCKTLDDLMKIVDDETTHMYAMDNIEEIEDFTTSTNPDHVLAVAHWFRTNQGRDLEVCCNGCHKVMPAEGCVAVGLEGCGGCAYQHTNMMCESCYLAWLEEEGE